MGASVGQSSGRSSGRRRNRRGRLNADLNVTPLVDVMLVLLLVFMLVAQEFANGVALELPKTDAKSLPTQQEPITISVDSEGNVFILDNPIALEDLVTRLVAISGNGYEERIYLRADESSDYGEVMKVMARINAAGFTNLGLVTDPVTP